MRERMTVEAAARLLGVPPDAALPEIHGAYRRLARELHPDLLPAASDDERVRAAHRFDEVGRARAVLLEQRPVVAIQVSPPPTTPRRGRSSGVGGALMLLTLLAFVLLAIVSLDDAYNPGFVGPLGPVDPPASSSAP